MKSRPILLELARYIVLNPVRACMVYTAEEWPWNSYRGTIGLQVLPESVSTDWILASFGESRDKAIPCYKRFVQEGRDKPSPWEGLKNQVYLGSDAFVAQMVSKLDGQEKLSEISAIQKRRVAQPLADFESTTPNRNSAIGAYNLKEIADHFELHRSSVSRIVRGARCKTCPRFRRFPFVIAGEESDLSQSDCFPSLMASLIVQKLRIKAQ